MLLIEPEVFRDERGFFLETYSLQRYAFPWGCASIRAGQPLAVRARHPQGVALPVEAAPGKLVRCVRGRIFDVAVDISRGSPTFGHWVGIELSAAEASEVEYKGTDYYAPDDECGIIWKDP